VFQGSATLLYTAEMRRAVCQRQLSFLSLSWEWVSQEVAGGFFIAIEGAAITALEENFREKNLCKLKPMLLDSGRDGNYVVSRENKTNFPLKLLLLRLQWQ